MMLWSKVAVTMSLTLFLVFASRWIGFSDERNVAHKLPKQVKATRERLVRGKAIFNYYCSPCHGLKGDGRGPNAGNLSSRPRDFTDKPYMDTKGDQDLYKVVKGGGSAVGLSFLMPPWGETLSEQGLFDVIVTIRTFEKSGQSH